LAVRSGDSGQLRRLYAGWGFRTLLSELEGGTLRQGDLFQAGTDESGFAGN
jgi:hypothetical protein